VSFAELYRGWSAALFLDGLENRSGPSAASTDWVLAGPRQSRRMADGSTETWTMTGTSTHYAIVEGSAEGGVDIEVVGPPETQLQVTAVRLPPDLPSLELAVRNVPGGDGTRSVRLIVRQHGGGRVHWTSLAWEPLVPHGDSADAGARHGGLDAHGLEKAFGTSSLGPDAQIVSEVITLSGVRDEGGPLVLKLVGADSRGRRVVAWGELGGEVAAVH
jgi:hypothetical protein